METNVSRTVAPEETAELLARVRPFGQPHVAGIGEVLQWGELWLLVYDSCGHEQYFFRGPMNYEWHQVEHEVRQYHAECQQCLADAKRKRLENPT